MLHARKSLAAIAAAIPLTVLSPSAAPAHAASNTLITHRTVSVCEHQYDVDTGTYVRPGDRLVVSATGTIWTGWWFIGRNGPQGLWFNGEYDYPSPADPADSLLFKTGGSYHLAGTGTDFVSQEPENRLRFRINDNVPGNGNGCFSVTYNLYR
jgi:hypothetical protein